MVFLSLILYSMTMSAKAIIFDKDGTLFPYSLWREPMRLFLFHKLPLSGMDKRRKEECVEKFLFALGFQEDGKINKKGLFPRRNYPSSFFTFFLLTLRYSLNPLKVAKALLKVKERYKYGYKKALVSFDFSPLKAQLDKLISSGGPDLALFTNDSKESLDILFSVLGKEYFSYCINSQSPYKKPNPRCIKDYSRFSNINTEEMILISDSITDLKMGRRSDVGIVVAIEGTQEKERLEKWADFVFPDIVSALSFFTS